MSFRQQKAGGRPSIRKNLRGGPSLRVLQGWAALHSPSPSPAPNCSKRDILKLRQFRRRRNMPQLDRITQDPSVMGGKPCIRGMRVTVGMVVGQIGAGHTIEEVLADYPYLEREDVLQALRYAAWRSEEREVTLPRA